MERGRGLDSGSNPKLASKVGRERSPFRTSSCFFDGLRAREHVSAESIQQTSPDQLLAQPLPSWITMQLRKQTKTSRDEFEPERSVGAVKSATASRTRIRSLLVPFLETSALERMRSGVPVRLRLDLELPVLGD